MRKRLLAIYDDVERRARVTAGENAWWPCKRGCDLCCRRLADVPQLVRAEWELLQEGLDALAPDVRAGVDARIADLAGAAREGRLPRHITCPMLDEREGACLVYAHRPSACRTYGFYVERGVGLHCEMITDALAARPEAGAIVWGNQEGVDYALARLSGDAVAAAPLTSWAVGSSLGGETPDAPPAPSSPSSAI